MKELPGVGYEGSNYNESTSNIQAERRQRRSAQAVKKWKEWEHALDTTGLRT